MKILKTFVKWVAVLLGGTGCFLVQHAFTENTGEVMESFMFACYYYSINYVAYVTGLVLFFVGFFLSWKLFLKDDWKKYSGEHWLWKVGYVLLMVLVVVGLFFSNIIVEIMSSGFGSYKQQKLLFIIMYLQLIYVLLLPGIDLLLEKIKFKTLKDS